jgi:hypothetical protein
LCAHAGRVSFFFPLLFSLFLELDSHTHTHKIYTTTPTTTTISNSWFLRDERTRIERAKKEEEDAAMQARIEAGKQMAAQREADRLEMERQSHYAELRAKKRRRGKGKGQGSEADDWKARRKRSEMVGVCDTAAGDLWFAFLDKTVGAKDGGGTIFYHNDKLEERNGVGSSWDRPVDWEGVVGGPDMMKKVHEHLVSTGQRAPDADAAELTKEEQEAQFSEKRLAKIEAEKQRRVDEAIREKQEHYVAVVGRVRRFIDERARLPGDRYDLRRPFDNFDADGQGSIDKEEFTQVLELLFVGEEIDFWPDEVDRLMAVFDDTQDGFITFGKFVRFAMGENPNVDTGLPEPENLIANGDDALGIRIRKLLEKIYEWTEDFDPATDRKYWYNPASASSVYEEPESLGAAVKALEAEKALIDSQRREKTANDKQRKAEAKAEKHMKQLPKTMGEFVQKLAGNSEFVDMLAKQLGLEKKKVDPEIERQRKGAKGVDKGKRAALDRERRRLEGMGVEFGDADSTYSGEGGEEKDPGASSDSDSSDDDDDGAIAAEKRRQALLRPRDDTLSRQAELERRKLAWRRMKPANVKKNFVTAATSCKVAKAPASLCKANTPSVCGIVDPAEAIVHVQPPQLIPPRVDFVEDVMASSDRLRALADGGEEAMAATEKKVAEADLMEENTAKMFSYVRNADFEGVDTMLDEGVDVGVKDVNGNTPLLIAAQQGLKKIAKLLLRRGAKINEVSLSGNSVLHYCFTYSFESLGEYFISKGADDSLTNAAGEYNERSDCGGFSDLWIF